ncbi:MAG: FGGY-family carbohydrate kinase [Desulfopila sp.]
MATETSLLTIDIGSTSMRANLHDGQGKIVHSARRATTPTYFADNRVELDIETFVANLYSLLRESAASTAMQMSPPAAIAVTSQRSSVVAVDHEGRPLTGCIMWHDKRTVPLCQKLARWEPQVYDRTGLRISPVLSAVKMTWIRENLPDIYARTHKLLGIHDVALHALCGRFVTDTSLASNTNLLNLWTRQWDPDLLEIFAVQRRHLCDIVPPGTICGTTTENFKQMTGLAESIPVISAGGDQQCAALGLGIFKNGRIKCTTGTGSYLIAHADQPIIDQKRRFLCKVAAVPGAYNLEAGILTTGAVYRWFIEQFYGPATDPANLERINNEVVASPPGANGVLFLPHFEGSGAPHWCPDDTGAFYHLKLANTRADMARAVMEGIVMEMGDNLQLFKEKIGEVPHVCLSGGMTAFAAYNQLQADIFATDAILYPHKEATAIGAWISAAVTMGLYSSYSEAFQVAQPAERQVRFRPDAKREPLYNHLNITRRKLYKAMRTVAA